MEDSEMIISGPADTGPEYWGSVAEYLIPKMKAHPKDCIIQVDCGKNETITSPDFLQQSLEITEGLIELGLKAEDLVIHTTTNSIRSHVSAMGVVLSGGILSPVDKNLRPFELQYFFKEFKPKFVICETEKAKEVQSCVKEVNMDIKVIVIDADVSNGEFLCWEDIRTKVDVDNYVPRGVADPKKSICVVNCSSGSTGMPKGVALSHYAFLVNFSSMESAEIPEIQQSFLFTSPLCWISGTIFFFNSSYFGQTRYVPKSTVPEDVLQALEKCQPSFLLLAPSSITALVRMENFKKYDLSSVKVIISAGAPLPQSTVKEIQAAWPTVKISNFYGLTEASGGIIGALGGDDPTAIGQVLPGYKVKVVDVTTGKSLGPNQTGELRVKSRKLMNGYYCNEKATKAAFDENGWLRTGDLMYYDDKHIFHFVSRIQETIPFRNYRIAPSELEGFILGLPGVKDVAVGAVPHEMDWNHLRALVVKDPKIDITAEEIIRKVEDTFAFWKHLRAGVQFVDRLPRTEVGKIRRLEVQKLIQSTK